MQGYFDVQLKDAPGLGDDDFRGLAPAELGELLDSLETVRRAEGKNLCNDNLAAYILHHIMSGGSISNPWNRSGVGGAGMTINVENQDADPTYTEGWEEYADIHNPGWQLGTGDSGKRFIIDDVEAHLIQVAPLQKEEVQFRSRWLYLPSEIVSGNIRSIGYFYSDVANTTSSRYRGHYGRFRLKDSGGNPVVLSKSSSQVLLVQITLKFVTI
jgi:hypothetical protein